MGQNAWERMDQRLTLVRLQKAIVLFLAFWASHGSQMRESYCRPLPEDFFGLRILPRGLELEKYSSVAMAQTFFSSSTLWRLKGKLPNMSAPQYLEGGRYVLGSSESDLE